MDLSGVRRHVAPLLLVAALAGGCSGNDSGPEASPTTSAPTTATSLTPSAPPQAAKLPGTLIYSDFTEVNHTFMGTFIVSTDGSGAHEVPMPSSEGGAAWSPDGESLAVPVLQGERVTTAIIRADGTVLKTFRPLRSGLNLVCTVWAPDGSRLACEGFNDSDPASRGIYSVRASDGGDVVRMTTSADGLVDSPGSWTSDGSRLVFKRSADEADGQLFMVGADGGRPTVLVDDPVEDAGSISPDGRTLLTSGGGKLLVYSITGELIREISDDGAYLFGAVWSPDGRHIAYSRAVGGPYADLWVALPDGTDAGRVADVDGNAINVDWGR